MNKIFKKFLVVILALTIVFTSTITSYEKTNAAGLTLGTIARGVVFLGSVYFACDYISNPDKYSDLIDSMKDFANTTVENQKMIYEIEKANFQMVMDKAVDAGVGTCLVGPNGVHITAKQLQQQEYPEFDTWKGYKEKESQKPSGSLWKNFQLGVELADMLIGLFSNSGSGSGSVSGGEDEQLYYTGDDGYIDRETGELSISFTAKCNFYEWTGNESTSGFRTNIYRFTCNDTIGINERVCMAVSSRGLNKLYYIDEEDGRRKTCNYRFKCYFGYLFHGSLSNCNFKNIIISSHVWSLNDMDYIDSSSVATTYSEAVYSCHALDDVTPQYRLWDGLSTNIPVFESSTYAKAYMENGSLEGLINGAPEEGPTPTDIPAPPSSTVSPVSQYVNYFSGTFSPSVMPYYVNYNIVNNWDGNDTTFNINDYTGVLVPTLTPAPDADGKDTNVTNNILIVQTNILTEINETVTNIYNFFQIDVDYITEELQVDSDENPTGFDNLKNLLSEFESAFPADKFDAVTQELDLLYPKITIKVPKALDKFLKVGDDKIILEDGVKKIVLCDFNEYAIYFVRFRKFLEIVLRIGLIFYLLKELTVVFTVA